MQIEKYSEPWLIGFAEETAKLGLNEAGAKDLLKFAAAMELKDSPEFREGFDKAAAPLPDVTLLAKLLGGVGQGVSKAFEKAPVLSTLGTIGAGTAGYYGLYRPNVGMGPYERQVQRLRDAVDYGMLDEDQMLAAARLTAEQSANRRASAAGLQQPYRPYGG